ncbi:hypothetical protein ABI59_21965 [Acidobacteria bacterium Mor1]|nr:hypothetical protein ABI59_21965 [Acidobacteria bacterium Mor1]
MGRLTGLLVCCAASVALCVADEVRIDRVEPAVVYSDEAAEITVRGDGFTLDSRFSLIDGSGPTLLHDLKLDGRAFAIQRDPRGYAFVGGQIGRSQDREALLHVLDLSTPEMPVRAARLNVPGQRITGLALDGHFLFMAVEASGLTVVHVEDPLNPEIVAEVPEAGSAFSVQLHAGYLFVCSGVDNVLIYDIQAPAAPALVGFLQTPGWAHSFNFAGRFGYLADGAGGLHVVDLIEPTQPRIVATVPAYNEPSPWSPTGYTFGSVLDDTRVYTIDSWGFWAFYGRIQVIDVADPANPRVIANHEPEVPARQIHVLDGLVYLTGSAGFFPEGARIQVADFSDPLKARFFGSATQRGAYRFDPVGQMGYLIYQDYDGNGGVRVVDLRGPLSRAMISRKEIGTETGETPQALSVRGEHVYVATSAQGPYRGYLEVLDVADPANPTTVERFPTARPAGALVERDGLLFLAGQGLAVMSLADPLRPLTVGDVEFRGGGTDLALDGDLAFVASTELYVVDISDPENPAVVGSVETPAGRFGLDGVAARDGYAYVADGREGLQVVDATEPTAPRIVTTIPPVRNETTKGVRVVNGHLVTVSRSSTVGWIQIYDLSNPAAPAPLSHMQLENEGYGIEGNGNLAYVSGRGPGLDGSWIQAIDLSDPSRPTLVAAVDVPGYAYDSRLGIADSHLFALEPSRYPYEDPGLLRVFRFQPAQEHPNPVSATEMTGRIPPGLSPGPYNVRHLLPEETISGRPAYRPVVEKAKALWVCERRTLQAELDPRYSEHGDIVWRAALDGDPALFVDESPQVALEIPELGPAPEVRFVLDDRTGRTTIDIHVDGGRREVTLSGADRHDVERLWQEAVDRGGLLLPQIDDRHYGDIELGLRRTTVEGLTGRGTSAGHPASPEPPTTRYVYTLSGSTLTAAAGYGSGANHWLRVSAAYDDACEAVQRVSYRESLRDACEELVSGAPGVALDCPAPGAPGLP